MVCHLLICANPCRCREPDTGNVGAHDPRVIHGIGRCLDDQARTVVVHGLILLFVYHNDHCWIRRSHSTEGCVAWWCEQCYANFQTGPYLYVILLYIVVGLAITTMCIDLVGVQYIRKIHYFGRKLQDAKSAFAVVGGKVRTAL